MCGAAVRRQTAAGWTARSPPAGPARLARPALQRLRPGETGDLQIVRAEYGDGDTWRDVTPAVRSLCARGRLAMQVMNDIDGDPLVGVVKTLRVEYVHRGRSFTVSASEYAWIRIP